LLFIATLQRRTRKENKEMVYDNLKKHL